MLLRHYILLSLLAMIMTSCKTSTTAEIIRISLKEEQAAGAPIIDLREALNLTSHKKSDNIRFQIVDQSLAVNRNVPRSPNSAGLTNVPWVEVEAASGIVKHAQRVDREALCGETEEIQDCFLVIKVIMLPQTAIRLLTLNLFIEDINDNDPIFPAPVIDLNLSEYVQVGHEINLDRDQATDLDTGNNSMLQYTLTPGDSYFSIHYVQDRDHSPHLRLIIDHILDYEITRVHRMTLTAHDGGVTSRSSTVEVKIHVTDENDNKPKFDQKVYEVTLSESMVPGQDVTRVQADDADSGLRGDVTYGICQNKEDERSIAQCPVTVNPFTGAITLREKLDHNLHDGLRLLVEATDGDDVRPMKSNAILLLHVNDVNDHRPKINVNYVVEHLGDTAYITENTKRGSVLALISASDADKGNNGKIVLTVETVIPGTEHAGNMTEAGKFTMNDDLLTSNIKLDREARDKYEVVIQACDQGIVPLCSTFQLTVIVLDENEFAPVFDLREIELFLREDQEVGSVITTVTATDRDDLKSPAYRLSQHGEVEPSLNGVITYGMTFAEVDATSNDVVIPITVDPSSGKITLIRALDYETRKQWKLIVTARDGGRPLARQSSCKLLLEVGNANDNTPIFIQPNVENSTVYASTLSISPIFTRIKAVDFGLDEETELVYTFHLLKKDGRFIHQETFNDLFALNPATGTFSMHWESFSKRDILGRYKAKIMVTDSGSPPLTSSMTLYIEVIDTEIPVVSISLPKYVDDEENGSQIKLFLAIAGGCGVVMMLMIIVAIFLVRKRHRRGKNAERSGGVSPAISRSASQVDVEQVLTVRTTNSTREPTTSRHNRRDCESINRFNTSSTQHTSVSGGSDQQYRLYNAPKSPSSTQKYIDQQPSLCYKVPTQSISTWSPPQSPSRDRRTEKHVVGMGGQCTEMCKLYGHSDTCWMPVKEHNTALQPETTRDLASPWQQRHASRRKDSGCSVDTTSSALSYYKMGKPDSKRHNDVFHPNDVMLPDVVNKTKAGVSSDASSLMSSTASSGASSTHPSCKRIYPTERLRNQRLLKKSNSDFTQNALDKTENSSIPNSLSTPC